MKTSYSFYIPKKWAGITLGYIWDNTRLKRANLHGQLQMIKSHKPHNTAVYQHLR